MKFNGLVVLLGCVCFTKICTAATPLGDFGHEFTRDKKDVVWTILPRGKVYELLSHGDHSVTVLHEMSAVSIKSFWKKMLWPEFTGLHASCLGGQEEIFCHVPEDDRKKIDWLSGNHSDFFFYSEMGGVMEIRRIEH